MVTASLEWKGKKSNRCSKMDHQTWASLKRKASNFKCHNMVKSLQIFNLRHRSIWFLRCNLWQGQRPHSLDKCTTTFLEILTSNCQWISHKWYQQLNLGWAPTKTSSFFRIKQNWFQTRTLQISNSSKVLLCFLKIRVFHGHKDSILHSNSCSSLSSHRLLQRQGEPAHGYRHDGPACCC